MSLITKYQKLFFHKYGFVILKNQLNDNLKYKLKILTNEIEHDSLKINTKHLHKFEFNNLGSKRLCRSEDLLKNEKITKILTEGYLPSFISKIYGRPVNLFKEKINYKYPNTGGYRPHQDITAYPNSLNHITALINLCDTNEKNGSIQFSPLIKNNISYKTILDNDNGIIKNSENLKWEKPLNTKFGDVVLFNSYIPHRSSINYGDYPRKALYLTYNDSLEGNKRKEYYDLKKKNLGSDKISLINHYDGKIIGNINQNSNHKQYIIDYILNLYLQYGNTKYDKNGSQLQHAFTVMDCAIKNNYSDKFQLTCFLHDIGHLLLDENNNNDGFLLNDLKHEFYGYNFLKQFLSKDIVIPIMLHVKAKRYLCTVNQDYYNNLSEASKKSFTIQGGKMTNKQIENFQNNEYFSDAIKLRKFEDSSKKNMTNCKTDRINYIEKLLQKYILCNN